MRGEYKPTMWNVCWRPELPPRARRIPNMCSICHMICGTTSACAENTTRWRAVWKTTWNYLRVRGEYGQHPKTLNSPMELPPRARRIRIESITDFVHQGTTSACAENTNARCRLRCRTWNYLRVRGEYRQQRLWVGLMVELPPRARRIHARFNQLLDDLGTTSACAENTQTPLLKQCRARNYLRVRGEYTTDQITVEDAPELPPRARRIPI